MAFPRPSPWTAWGGLAGGLAEGAALGLQMTAQQQRLQLAREEMEQRRMQNALTMLLKGAELEQTLPGLGAQIMEKAGAMSPELRGIKSPFTQGGGTPWEALSRRAMEQTEAMIRVNPALAQHRDELFTQNLGLKDLKLQKESADQAMVARALGIPMDPAKRTPQQNQQMLQAYHDYLVKKQEATWQARINLDVPLPGMGGRGGGAGDFWKSKAWFIMPDGSRVFGDIGNPPEGYVGMQKVGTTDPGQTTQAPVRPQDLKMTLDMIEADPTIDRESKKLLVEGLKKSIYQSTGVPGIVTHPSGLGGPYTPMQPPKQKIRVGGKPTPPGLAPPPGPLPPGFQMLE